MAKVRLNFDSLDSRSLMSATLTNGILHIDGSAGRDVIVVRQNGDNLWVRGEFERDGARIEYVLDA